MKPLYTVRELADALHLQPETIRNKLSRGEDMPRSILVGRRRLFPEDEVESWLQTHGGAVITTGYQSNARDPQRVGRPRGPAGVSARLLPRRGHPKSRGGERRENRLPTQMALFGSGC